MLPLALFSLIPSDPVRGQITHCSLQKLKQSKIDVAAFGSTPKFEKAFGRSVAFVLRANDGTEELLLLHLPLSDGTRSKAVQHNFVRSSTVSSASFEDRPVSSPSSSHVALTGDTARCR